MAAQIPNQHGQLVEQHDDPAHRIAVRQSFDLHFPHQHEHRSSRHTEHHVEGAGHQRDLQIANAAEEALNAVGESGHQVEQGNRAQETHEERIYEPAQLIAMLEQAGFKSFKLYADFEDKEPTKTSKRWFFVAQK